MQPLPRVIYNPRFLGVECEARELIQPYRGQWGSSAALVSTLMLSLLS